MLTDSTYYIFDYYIQLIWLFIKEKCTKYWVDPGMFPLTTGNMTIENHNESSSSLYTTRYLELITKVSQSSSLHHQCFEAPFSNNNK